MILFIGMCIFNLYIGFLQNSLAQKDAYHSSRRLSLSRINKELAVAKTEIQISALKKAKKIFYGYLTLFYVVMLLIFLFVVLPWFVHKH
jgi:hypothetical protein